MLQDSYIIAPLVWCMIKVVITQKSNDGTWYFVVDPTSSVWLAWQGRNEYQKVEAYRNWAQQFERAVISMRC